MEMRDCFERIRPHERFANSTDRKPCAVATAPSASPRENSPGRADPEIAVVSRGIVKLVVFADFLVKKFAQTGVVGIEQEIGIDGEFQTESRWRIAGK